MNRLLKGKNDKDQLVKLHDRYVRRSISTALKKAGIVQNRRGGHGFRHAYARERVSELMKQRGLNERGYTMLQRCLANYDARRKVNYGIHSNGDRQLYDKVKLVVDCVHGELGHGEGRWDLAAVYMKD
ncbi:hypothetical protein [Domibacillus tundrae]|uniref:hypothetical protein n=1 Tax=Domibacillus tundrae TaxID=1587527 RepID=UPI0033979199